MVLDPSFPLPLLTLHQPALISFILPFPLLFLPQFLFWAPSLSLFILLIL